MMGDINGTKMNKTVSELTAEVYDKIAREYSQHATSNYLDMVQWIPIECILDDLIGPDRRDKKFLLVGIGDMRQHLRQMLDLEDSRQKLKLDDANNVIDRKNITLFDISPNILNTNATKMSSYGRSVLGDASYLGAYFPEGSFDFVLGFLCDHIADQDGFFEGGYKILKEHGVLMTTYPGKELQYAIRKGIYNIDVNMTRFQLNGKQYFLPSKLYTLKELYEFYKRKGFGDVSVSGWCGDDGDDLIIDEKVTPTILQGYKIIGKSTKTTNIVTMGIGGKGGILNCSRPNYEHWRHWLVDCLYDTQTDSTCYYKRVDGLKI